MMTQEFPQLIIERVEDVSALSNFYCGYKPMDVFIHNKDKGLNKYISEGLTNLWIVKTDQDVIAIFALSKSSIVLNTYDFNELTRQGVKIDPDIYDVKENFPAIEIDYLAVDSDYRNKGLGEYVIEKIYERACEDYFTATMFLLVDAIDTPHYSAVGFYKKCGFKRSEKFWELKHSGNQQNKTLLMYRFVSRSFLSKNTDEDKIN